VFHSRLWSSVSPLFHTFFALALICLLHLLGASGTGRTTFVNTLCESEVLSHNVSDSPETAHVEEGIRIKPVNVGALPLSATNHSFPGLTVTFLELEEDGVRIALTIVDTPGFGDKIDNEFAYVLSFDT